MVGASKRRVAGEKQVTGAKERPRRKVPPMKRSTRIALGSIALAVGAAPVAVAPAQAHAAPGETSLASVLTSDGNKFDKNAKDFDIVTEAALAVIDAKPETPVGLLADGSTRLTVFAPTDQAFRLLAKDLTGKTIKSEKKILSALVDLAGVDTIETVLLYHVVPGKTLTSNKVLKANGAKLETAAGETVKVKIRKNPLQITLKDRDRNDRNARVVLEAIDVNKGNKQVAHGVDRVLRPIDL
jgi:uncharacterized surface protein with fasciclin (FAS1) repeats